MAHEDVGSGGGGGGASSPARRRKRPLDQDGLSLYRALDKVLYPGSHTAMVMGSDISHHVPSLMYGELSGATLRTALGLIRDSFGGLPAPGTGALLDIGSGIGKQVFTAACLWPWRRCVGLEIYDRRHKLAVQALGRWKGLVVPAATAAASSSSAAPTTASLDQARAAAREAEGSSDLNEDEEEDVAAWEPGRDPLPPTLEVDFMEGDVVELGAAGYQVLLLVSAAFTDSLLQQMALALDDCAVGTFAICITKGLPSEKWAVLHDSPREEPWGKARLIIQKKVA